MQVLRKISSNSIIYKFLHTLYGEAINKLTSDIQRNPRQTRHIILGLVLNVTIKSFIVSFVLGVFGVLVIPQIALVGYAMTNDLSIIDVLNVVDRHATLVMTLVIVFTMFIVILIMLPGFMWFIDKEKRKLSWLGSDKMRVQGHWIRFRWFLAFIPGVCYYL